MLAEHRALEAADGAGLVCAPHGAVLDARGRTLRVIEGQVEALDEGRFRPFDRRRRYRRGDVVSEPRVVAVAGATLIDTEARPTPPSSEAPWGVSLSQVYLLGHAVSSLHDLGWFRLARAGGERSIAADAVELGCRADIFARLLRLLTQAGIAEVRGATYAVDQGELLALERDVGYLKFFQRGYGPVLDAMPAIARGELRYAQGVRRSDAGASEFLLTYPQHVEPAVMSAAESVPFRRMAYPGCGGGARLIELARRHPRASFVGVDIDQRACDAARRRVAEAGLQDRVSVEHQDLLAWAAQPHPDVDALLLIVGMAHDFLQKRETARGVFAGLRANLAPGATLLVEDINVQPAIDPGPGLSISEGFELVHELMGARLGTRERYEAIFRGLGWDVEQVRPTGLPNAWIYVLTASGPAAPERGEICLAD